MTPFTAEERDDLNRRILDLAARAAKAEGESAPGWRELASELAALETEYMRRVPPQPLSWDPIRREPFLIAIDTMGFDGPWWESDGPPRPSDEALPATFYAYNGAARLVEPYERNGYPIRVGPIAPYVVPRLLQRPGVVAVVSQVPIGRHTGWLIVYYAPEGEAPPGKRVNEWGRKSYRVRDRDEPFGWDTAFDYPLEWDFDLAPWIGAGKLLWTPPGAPSDPARDTVDGCPYLGLLGPDDPRSMGILSFGRLRYAEITDALANLNPNEG